MNDDEKKRSLKASFNKQKAPRIRTVPMPADAYVGDLILADWLMAHMDIAGGGEAYEFTKNRVVTVGVDAMSFHKPVHIGDDVSIYTDISYVGDTSVGIQIEAWARNRQTGKHERVTEGLFTFVSLDQNGRPQQITDRKGHAQPQPGQIPPRSKLPQDEKKPRQALPVRLKNKTLYGPITTKPEDRNASGNIFGGWLLSQMDKACADEALGLTGQSLVTAGVEAMTFHKPVHVGDEISFYTEVVKTGRTSIALNVESWVQRKDSQMYEKVTEGTFTFVAVDKNRQPVPINAQTPSSGTTTKRKPGGNEPS